jgi:hypothetical protein
MQRGACLFQALKLEWNAGTHPLHLVREAPRAGRASSQPNGGHLQQPKRGKRETPHRPLQLRRRQEGCLRREGIEGKKWHVLVDMQSLLMHAITQAADIPDCDGVLAMTTLFAFTLSFSSSAPMAEFQSGASLGFLPLRLGLVRAHGPKSRSRQSNSFSATNSRCVTPHSEETLTIFAWPQASNAMMIGSRLRPRSVRLYSTLGGICR